MNNFLNKIYYLMLFLSILPLFFVREIYPYYIYISLFLYFIILFIYQLQKEFYYGKNKFFLVIDLMSIISLLTPYKYLMLLRFIRIFKFMSKVRGYRLISEILIENKDLFISVYGIVIIYMILTSLILFQIEPQTFGNNYFNSLYWSGISITTVGYGDIYPVTVLGKAIGIISSLIGIGIVALPTGLIASKFMEKHDN